MFRKDARKTYATDAAASADVARAGVPHLGWRVARPRKNAPLPAIAKPSRDTVRTVPEIDPNVATTTSAETPRPAAEPNVASTAAVTGWAESAARPPGSAVMTATCVSP